MEVGVQVHKSTFFFLTYQAINTPVGPTHTLKKYLSLWEHLRCLDLGEIDPYSFSR